MKRIKVLMTTLLIFSVLSITAWAGEWKSDGRGWWWQNDDGSYPVNQWKEIDRKQYYFGADGYMLADTTTPDGYQVGADGAWIQSGQAEIQDNQYLDAYAAFLRSYKIPKGSSSKPRFHLLYIDGDAIPELVIADNGSHVAPADLYCYTQGVVQHLGKFGDFGEFSYVQGLNLFCDTQNYNGGGGKWHYYTLQNNIAVPLIDFSINSVWNEYGTTDYFYINSIPVTKDIYDSQKAVWDAAYTPVNYAGYGYGHTLNETNIKKMLENIQDVMPKK